MRDDLVDLHSRLEEVIQELERRFGPGVVYRLSQARPKLGASSLSTGSLSLDLATGIDGVPRGRIAIIEGSESCGKTTLAYQILANAQSDGGLAALIDTAQSADPEQLRCCGVDLQSLLLAEPLDVVEAVEMATILTHSAALDAVVVSRLPRPLRSGFLAETARRLNAAVSGTPTALVIVGHADFASLSIHLRPLRLILRPGGDVAGLRVRAEVVKNRLAPPNATAEFDVLEGAGTHRPSELFDLGRALDLIDLLSVGFVYGGAVLGKGRAQAIVCLARDSDLSRRLEAEIRQRARNSAVTPSTSPVLRGPALVP